MPPVSPCERHLPAIKGGSDAEILQNQADTWASYQECMDSLDAVIKADKKYREALKAKR